MSQNQKIHVATILGPHGVRGQVKVASLTQEPADLFTYKPLTNEGGTRTFDLKRQGAGGDVFIASIAGIQDRNEAEALAGTKLFFDRALLPAPEEGEYYLADLKGLEARDAQGRAVGRVEATHDYGAGVFLEIKPAQAKSFMLPFKDAFVPRVDITGGFLQVEIPEGWLGEEKKGKEKSNSQVSLRGE